ncbi:MAG TPA: hypothetical protein VN522_06695 [Solirubrobacterales bacterium]|nr:hypothetical protein [Solirubrobacterales bacterium]
MAPLVGLGNEERGKEDPEVHKDPIRLGDAQLHRTGPEGRDCRPNRQTKDQAHSPEKGLLEQGTASEAEREKGDHNQPDRESRDVPLLQSEASFGKRQPHHESYRSE